MTVKYVVIFRARISQLDRTYAQTAKRMRDLAMGEYRCHEFVSVCEGNEEIALSYWESLEDISAWKLDVQHLAAQEMGRDRWYDSYQIEVAEIKRSFGRDAKAQPGGGS